MVFNGLRFGHPLYRPFSGLGSPGLDRQGPFLLQDFSTACKSVEPGVLQRRTAAAKPLNAVPQGRQYLYMLLILNYKFLMPEHASAAAKVRPA
jgi:hypothetical protein